MKESLLELASLSWISCSVWRAWLWGWVHFVLSECRNGSRWDNRERDLFFHHLILFLCICFLISCEFYLIFIWFRLLLFFLMLVIFLKEEQREFRDVRYQRTKGRGDSRPLLSFCFFLPLFCYCCHFLWLQVLLLSVSSKSCCITTRVCVVSVSKRTHDGRIQYPFIGV